MTTAETLNYQNNETTLLYCFLYSQQNLKTCWENNPTKTERHLQNPKSSNTISYTTNNSVKWILAFLVKYCVITNINMYIPIHIATRATCHPWIKILV